MTELSDELLVAYVDGQLVREQTRAVDKVLEHDDVIARRVETLKEAHGRFESAFEAILAGELIEVLAAPALPPRVKQKRVSGLAKMGLAVAGVGLALAALIGGYGSSLLTRACAVGMAGSVPVTQSAAPAPNAP
jgi:anti-sigma factor RsiW